MCVLGGNQSSPHLHIYLIITTLLIEKTVLYPQTYSRSSWKQLSVNPFLDIHWSVICLSEDCNVLITVVLEIWKSAEYSKTVPHYWDCFGYSRSSEFPHFKNYLVTLYQKKKKKKREASAWVSTGIALNWQVISGRTESLSILCLPIQKHRVSPFSSVFTNFYRKYFINNCQYRGLAHLY